MAEQGEEENNSPTCKEKNNKHPPKPFMFLKPCTTHPNKSVPVPNTPLLSHIFPQNLTQWPSKPYFKGWLLPHKNWKQWVESLTPKYASLWKKIGIYDAVISTTYQVPRHQILILGLSEFWSPETNTFVFPWGEATVTLEDTMILGGFGVLGEPVSAPVLDREMMGTVKILEEERVKMCQTKVRKAAHYRWISRFMGRDDELEHVAFLSLWLARITPFIRFVFPSHSVSVGNHITPVAVRLSCGRKVALAPAVLASIYRDLRALREGVLNSMEIISVSAPFQLLQLWALEHFSLLGPKSPKPLKAREPRVARWHKFSSKITNLPLIRSALQIKGNFEWRPYAADVENWYHLSYYREAKQTCSFDESCLDKELRSFFLCLRGCELVGQDCTENYNPHRVAMQFGLDQDLPSDPKKFHFVRRNAKLVVPPRNSWGSASKRYNNWWTNMTIDREKIIKGVLKEDLYAPIIKHCHGLVASSDHVNPKSCPQSSEKCRAYYNTRTATKKLIVCSHDVHGTPPGFSAKHGSTSSGLSNLVTGEASENSEKHCRDGKAKKVKTEGSWENELVIDVDELEEVVEPSKKRIKSSKCVATKKGKAGETSDNPISIDDSKEYGTLKPHPAHDFKEKLAKVEKIIRYLKSEV